MKKERNCKQDILIYNGGKNRNHRILERKWERNKMISKCQHADELLLKKLKKIYGPRYRLRETNAHFDNRTT